MNPLLVNLFRGYRTTGTPRLERQATDLAALVLAERAEAEAAAVRAVQGYAKAKLQERRLRRWAGRLPCVLREQAE